MRALFRRVRFLVLARRLQRELAEELAFHRAMKARELATRGLAPRDAEREATRAMGNELAARHTARDVWIWPWLQELAQDTCFAGRLLVRDRGFAVTAILVLGLGIGVNNMMFTLIYTHTMRSLPIPDADRVLFMSAVDDRTSDRPLSYPELLDLRHASSLQGVAAYVTAPVAIGEQGRAPERFEAAYTTANAVEVIGRPPMLGRPFADDEDAPGAPLVAILGADAWRARYASDPHVLGRTILVNGAPATVIGVMPSRSGFPMSADVFLPLGHMPGLATEQRDTRMLRVVGRVRAGVSVPDATVEIASIMERAAREHPDHNRDVRARIVPINERFLGRSTDPAWLAFLAASFLVVLVSSANVANLMIARSAQRTRELAIRTSLGATRRRIVRQMLTESAVVAAGAAAVALGVSLVAARAFHSAIPPNTLPYWIDYRMDLRVFAALLVVACGTVIVVGLLPALYASRTDVNRVLKDGGRAGTGTGGAGRWTTVFLIAEFALTVVLLAHAVAAIRGRAPQVPSDRIVKTTALVTASVTLPATSYATPAHRWDFFRRLEERLRSVGGVEGASIVSVLPSRLAAERRLELAGTSHAEPERAPTVWSVAIAPRYFETLAVPLLRGREFDADDGAAGREHAVVNQRFVELFLSGRDPIGQRIRVTAANSPAEQPAWLTVIGVAGNVRQRPSPAPDPLVYLPLRASPPATAALIVRSTLDTATVTARLRQELLALDPNLPLYRAMTMARAIDEAEWNARISANLILSITAIAVALSVVGLYAVTAHAVRQRTQEIGIRVALGARPRHVRWFVLRRAGIQVGLGMFGGLLCTLGWNAAFASQRADVSFAAPANLAVVAGLLAATVLLACHLPVRRATSLDPVVALRSE